MTDEQYDEAHFLIDALTKVLQDTVNVTLAGRSHEVSEFVRLKLSEDMRFWD